MTIEKNQVSGSLLVSDIIDGYYVHRQYFGYTKKEAAALFRKEVAEMRRANDPLRMIPKAGWRAVRGMVSPKKAEGR